MNVLTTLAICFISAVLITLCIEVVEKLSAMRHSIRPADQLLSYFINFTRTRMCVILRAYVYILEIS